MSRQTSSDRMRLCQQRADIPGGSKEQRDRDFERTMRHERPFLIKTELNRIHPVDPAPDSLFSRIFQAFDVLLGRSHVYVDRRHPR